MTVLYRVCYFSVQQLWLRPAASKAGKKAAVFALRLVLPAGSRRNVLPALTLAEVQRRQAQGLDARILPLLHKRDFVGPDLSQIIDNLAAFDEQPPAV